MPQQALVTCFASFGLVAWLGIRPFFQLVSGQGIWWWFTAAWFTAYIAINAVVSLGLGGWDELELRMWAKDLLPSSASKGKPKAE